MEALSYITGPASMRTWWIAHNFVVGGEIKVPVGQVDVVPDMYVALAPSQTLKIARVRYSIKSGTSVSFKLQKNGSDITGFTGLSATTTVTNTDPTDVSLANDDSIQVVVTAVAGTPTNLTVSITLEYSA